MGEQRFGTLGGGGARIVASCLAIEDEHGLGRKILSGACELGLGAGTNRPSVASTTIMQSSKATGTYLKRLKRGGRPRIANSRSPCIFGVIASPRPPTGRMRLGRSSLSMQSAR